MDRMAIIRNAIPASHVLLVKSQTINATMAAGINMKSSLIISITSKPSSIRPINPKISINTGFSPHKVKMTSIKMYA